MDQESAGNQVNVYLAVRKGYTPWNNRTPGVGLVMTGTGADTGAEEKIKALGKKVIGRM